MTSSTGSTWPASGQAAHELSGGMRQRAALARALAQDAGLLLMDEPFGALDAITRDLLHDELESLWIDRGFTVLFVTHNVREAARLGDRIVLLTSRPGRVAATFPVDLARPRRIDSAEIAGAGGHGHRPAASRGGAPWRLSPDLEPATAPLIRPTPGPTLARGPGRTRRPRRRRTAVAGRLSERALAGDLAETGRPRPHPAGLAVRGVGPLEAVHLPVAGGGRPPAVGAARHLLFWQACWVTAGQAVVGYALVILVGGIVGTAVARSPCCGPASAH